MPSEAMLIGILVIGASVATALITGWVRARNVEKLSTDERDIQIAILSTHVEHLQEQMSHMSKKVDQQMSDISKKVDQIWRCIPWRDRRDNGD